MLKVKYLWTGALVALCVAMASGTGFAAAGWDATDPTGFPSAMVWEEAADVSVTAENTGTTAADNWDNTWYLRSGYGTTTAQTPANRWGLLLAPPGGITPTAIGETTTIEWTITAPPITTLKYLGAAETTSAVDTLECDWQLFDGTNPVTTDIVQRDIVISRFPDDQPGSRGAWARHNIEMIAGVVPRITAGFPDGSYGPQVTVSRDMMAVFIYRAAQIELTYPASATFDDVPTDYWAFKEIESCYAAEVVAGYSETAFQPTWSVTRAQMAQFVFNAKTMPATEPAVPTFPDVPTGYWAYEAIETCVLNGVVAGYDDGFFRPAVTLSRDQMAVFLCRGFIYPTGRAVVLGGPDVVIWGDQSHAHVDPQIAYVLFDRTRLDTNLCAGTNGTWDIRFEFRDAQTPTSTVDFDTVNVTENDITTATGTYFDVAVAVPGTLPSGDYILTVLVEDETGAMHEIDRVEADPGNQVGRVVTFKKT